MIIASSMDKTSLGVGFWTITVSHGVTKEGIHWRRSASQRCHKYKSRAGNGWPYSEISMGGLVVKLSIRDAFF
jgi:hypothetical protein